MLSEILTQTPVLVLLVINFKPSGLLGEWELSPRGLRQLADRLAGKQAGRKKEDRV